MKPEQWILRWFAGDEGEDYRAEDGCGFTYDQKKAKRFGSAAEAKACVDPDVLYGAGGSTDKVGIKALRLVKKGSKG